MPRCDFQFWKSYVFSYQAQLAQPVEPMSITPEESFDWENDGELQQLMWETANEAKRIKVAEDAPKDPEVTVGAEDDHDAWVFEPGWEPNDGTWANWSGWQWSDWGSSQAKTESQQAYEEEDDAEWQANLNASVAVPQALVNRTEYPPWASKGDTNHLKNNSQRSNERGYYTYDDAGNPTFTTNEQHGGQTFGAHMGRQRGRTRGQGSQERQRSKQWSSASSSSSAPKGKGNDPKGKGKGKGKGKNKGKDKGKGTNIKSEAHMTQALSTMMKMASSTDKLINLLGDSTKRASKVEAESSSAKEEWSTKSERWW